LVELRRGFKTEANDTAREVRSELGLTLVDPLDPWRLAAHLDIPVVALSTLSTDAKLADYFLRVDTGAFSAVTVFGGTQRMIAYNDAHSAGRQSSDICHELSHGLLLHPPAPALGTGGCRNWDGVLELEAEWLAGALLISEEAALLIARQGLPLDAAAARYGVSKQMVQFRLNVTGARARVSRGRAGFRARRPPSAT
jgi:Zn-dependent peptidase ImmA (M78 family)